MKFTISTYDTKTFLSILWYCNNKCKNNNTHHFFIQESIYSNEDDEYLIDFYGFN